MRAGFFSPRIAVILLAMSIAYPNAVITSSSYAAETVSKLSAGELRQLFPGRFHAIAHGFLKIKITARADGSLLAQQIGKSDTGVWKIRSGQLCIKFTKWLKGRTRCSEVTEKAGWYRTDAVAFKRMGDSTLAIR
jgi:hypothetical protein